MEGREAPQDLPDHLFVSTSNHPAPSQPRAQLPQDLDWVGDFLQLPSHGGSGGDAAGAGDSSQGGAPGNGNGEGSITGKEKRKAGGGSYKMRKATKPRFAFRTKSSEDVLDDGYRWRKYGQKAVKNSIYPRYVYVQPL